jgi:hypothetical protein
MLSVKPQHQAPAVFLVSLYYLLSYSPVKASKLHPGIASS